MKSALQLESEDVASVKEVPSDRMTTSFTSVRSGGGNSRVASCPDHAPRLPNTCWPETARIFGTIVSLATAGFSMACAVLSLERLSSKGTSAKLSVDGGT